VLGGREPWLGERVANEGLIGPNDGPASGPDSLGRSVLRYIRIEELGLKGEEEKEIGRFYSFGAR
jgi:hypothetical protein